MTRGMRCRKTEDWRTNAVWMTVISCVTQSWCYHFFGTSRVGAGRNPLKKEAICCVNDLDAAPLEWEIGDVRSLAETSAVTAGSITLGVAVGSRQFITDQLQSKADVVRAMHERVWLCQDSQTEFALPRESLGASRVNHILRVHGHKQRAAVVYDEIGQRSLERLFPGLTEDSTTQATLTAGQSGIGFKETSPLLHTWELSLQSNSALRV